MRIITLKKLKEVYPKCYQEVLDLKWDISNLNRCIDEILFRNGIAIVSNLYYNHKDVLKGYNAKIRIYPTNKVNTDAKDIPIISCKDAHKAEKYASISALNLLEEHLAWSNSIVPN